MTGESVYFSSGAAYTVSERMNKLIFTCRSVDPSVALSLSGVRTFINADDVPGSNLTGYYVRDEEIFATDEVGAKLMPCYTVGSLRKP